MSAHHLSSLYYKTGLRRFIFHSNNYQKQIQEMAKLINIAIISLFVLSLVSTAKAQGAVVDISKFGGKAGGCITEVIKPRAHAWCNLYYYSVIYILVIKHSF